MSRDENGCLVPVAAGVRPAKEYDGHSVLWALYDRQEAEEEADLDGPEAAQALSGWTRRYSGPGRAFAQEPYVARVGRRRVLVKQICGLDV